MQTSIGRFLSALCATALLAFSLACGGGSKTTTGTTTGSPTPGTPNPTTGGTTAGGGSTTGSGTTTGGSGTTGGGTGTAGGGTTTGGGTGGGSGQQGQQFLFVAEEQTIQPFAISADGSLSASAGV